MIGKASVGHGGSHGHIPAAAGMVDSCKSPLMTSRLHFFSQPSLFTDVNPEPNEIAISNQKIIENHLPNHNFSLGNSSFFIYKACCLGFSPCSKS